MLDFKDNIEDYINSFAEFSPIQYEFNEESGGYPDPPFLIALMGAPTNSSDIHINLRIECLGKKKIIRTGLVVHLSDWNKHTQKILCPEKYDHVFISDLTEIIKYCAERQHICDQVDLKEIAKLITLIIGSPWTLMYIISSVFSPEGINFKNVEWEMAPPVQELIQLAQWKYVPFTHKFILSRNGIKNGCADIVLRVTYARTPRTMKVVENVQISTWNDSAQRLSFGRSSFKVNALLFAVVLKLDELNLMYAQKSGPGEKKSPVQPDHKFIFAEVAMVIAKINSAIAKDKFDRELGLQRMELQIESDLEKLMEENLKGYLN